MGHMFVYTSNSSNVMMEEVKVAYLLTLKNLLERKKLHKFPTVLKTVTIIGYKIIKMTRKHHKYLKLLKFLLTLN